MQNQLEDTTSADDMQKISDSCDELSEQYTALQQQLHSIEAELKVLLETPEDQDLDRYDALQRNMSVADACRALHEMEEKHAKLQQRAQHVTSSSVTPQQRKDIVSSFNFYRDAWRSRKLKAMEIIDMLADGMEKKQKDVVVKMSMKVFVMINQVLVGLETDEDEGVTLPPALKG